jgi:galactonate dehydratase
MPHNPVGPICTAASVHLLAAIPNCAWLEVRTPPKEPGREDHSDSAPERRAIFPKQVELDGTWYPVPTEPGLGIEVDERIASGENLRLWESPHLHRKDGSYTNH